jgi:hypothetical protein
MKSTSPLKMIFALTGFLFLAFITKAQGPNSDSSTGGPASGVAVQASSSSATEVGYADFPYTIDGITISLTTSSSGISTYSTPWNDCGSTVYTKSGSIWMGYGGVSGTITNTFSKTVNNATYNITASNTGETFTITTSSGTPTIVATAGCSYSIVGNVLSFSGGDVGATITVSTSNGFTWLQITHNGAGGGSLVTLEASTLVPVSVPVNIWAIVAVFLLIGGVILIRYQRTKARTV